MALAAWAGLGLAANVPGQIVLDDFSISNESNYSYLPLLSDPADGWAVVSGQFQPSIAKNATGAWLWSRGEKLSAVGQMISVDVSVTSALETTGAGLFLAPSSDSAADGHEVRFETTEFIQRITLDGVPVNYTEDTLRTLTARMTAQTANTSTYEFGPLTLVPSVTIQAPSAFFGLAAHSTAGTETTLDNLTFAVPEPPAYPEVFAFVALVAVWLTANGKGAKGALSRLGCRSQGGHLGDRP